MTPQAAYDELLRSSRERATLAACMGLLEWDEETYMPPGGVGARSEQRALLAGLFHDRATDPRVGELLGELEGSDLEPGSPEAANVRELRRAYDRETKLPKSLVEELARTTALAQQAWIESRKANDFPRFRPWLEKIVALKRQEAEAIGAEEDLYDALLDLWEPGATSRALAPLFEALRRELVPLAAALAAAPRQPDESILRREYPVERQRAFGRAIAAAIGFDFERGRIDQSAHPFCIGLAPGDCRLTARWDERYVNDGLFGVLHEAGHGMYEQGLDPGHHGTPMGEAASLGIHESQSRLWENLVGRSRAFWERFFPAAREAFPGALGDVTLDDFHFAVNRVAPSVNRVQADEVTYNLHILVRFELERALLSGDLPAADLPAAWNEAYREALGVVPPNDAQGCLQDTHWSSGLYGYFPTYTLGNVVAAQLFAAANEELGGLDEHFREGNFAALLGWLRERVHRHGRHYPPDELVRRATGASPDHRPLVAALRTKYSELYGL